jgi:hypothetical protein
VAKVQVKSPLFIIGHWRSGTTLIHNLLALDEQFSFPNLFQTSRPHTFLIQEPAAAAVLAQAPPKKRPMDNLRVSFDSPGEDEFALAILCQCSPIIGWSFPKRESYYDRYLVFRETSDNETRRWNAALAGFLQKLTYKDRRMLLLKSPTHTGRIRMLLALFPNARFIHIHRNPYTVFQSTRRLYETAVPNSYLQHPAGREQIDAGILKRYSAMYEAFFDEKDLVPEGQFCEVSFEALEQDKVGQLGQIYEALHLNGFAQLEPTLKAYVSSLSDYTKNTYPPLPDALRQQIAVQWARCIEKYG